MEKRISETISFVRFPLIVGILFIHNTSLELYKDSISGSGYKLCEAIGVLGSEIFSSLCVPAFFTISGFLYVENLNSWDYKKYKEKTARRIHSLLIPYIVWNTLAFILIFVKSFYEKGYIDISVIGFLKGFWSYSGGEDLNLFGMPIVYGYPVDAPLWYIRDLFLVSLLSPLLIWLINKTQLVIILLFSFLYLFSIWPPTVWLMGGTALCFFSLGIYCSLYLKDFCFNSGKEILIILSLTWLLSSFLLFNVSRECSYYLLLRHLYCFLGVFFVFRAASYFVNVLKFKWPDSFSSSVFFVYALHTIWINNFVIYKIVPAIIPPISSFSLVMGYFLSSFIVWLTCFMIYLFLKRYANPFLKVLNGNRA